MYRIEFIGAPGVGKTSLLETLVTKQKSSRNWRSIKEVKIEIASTLGNSHYSFNRRGLMKLGLFRSRHEYWANEVLSSYKSRALIKNLSKFDDIIMDTLYYYATENSFITSSFQRVQYINYCIELIKQYSLFSLFSYNRPIVFCEFLVHNLPIYNSYESIIKFIHKDMTLKEIVLPKAVIHCHLDAKSVLERRQNRMQKGESRFFDLDLSNDEIYKQCIISIAQSKKKRDALCKIGIPVLDLDMSKDLIYLSSEANYFIENL